MVNDTPSAETAPQVDRRELGQVVLILQGGSALGSYQAGVYQALQETGLEPDWLIGTAIGAVNAALIAGNPPERRVTRLREFWTRVGYVPLAMFGGLEPLIGGLAANSLAISGGVRDFFEPNPWAFAGPQFPLGAERTGTSSLGPLEVTLAALTDEKLLNAGAPRLTIGAANVRNSNMHYFDSRQAPVTIKHVKASAATPPIFAPVRIGDDYYWDGEIASNALIEAVFDDNPRHSSLIFEVEMWNPQGAAPDSIAKVFGKEKDLLYSSRAVSQIARQRQIHKLRHVVAEMVAQLPEDKRRAPEIRELAAFGCVTRMHIVRLVAPPLAGEDHAKDIDFSADGIKQRWELGYKDTMSVLAQAPWTHVFDPLEGCVLHETKAGRITFED